MGTTPHYHVERPSFMVDKVMYISLLGIVTIGVLITIQTPNRQIDTFSKSGNRLYKARLQRNVSALVCTRLFAAMRSSS
jgi:cell division septal protein FtsQ